MYMNIVHTPNINRSALYLDGLSEFALHLCISIVFAIKLRSKNICRS